MPRQLSVDETAAPLVPERPSLKKLKEAAAGCTACPLHETGTQTVFGAGSTKAKVVFVGEQPGDQEDQQGKPFVGPAGKLLDKALEDAGIDRSQVYVTNVVKHFKWQARGKRRIHQKPNWSEIAARRPRPRAELEVIEPRVLVCLGATAAQALLGRDFRVSRQRGELLESDLAENVIATVHPSSILRADDETRDLEYGELVRDLEVVARLI